jgi:hypothetical protein
MLERPIKTTNKIIKITGKVFYTDQRRRIDLKKPIKDLIDNPMDIFYVMELCLSTDKAKERITQLAEDEVMPILLYFNKGGSNGNLS